MVKSEPPTPVRAVVRAMDLVFALIDGPHRLGDLSERTNLSKATAYRLLLSLRATGMVMQDSATGDYALGPASFRLVTSLLRGRGSFLPYARETMEELRSATGETVTIHVRIGTGRMCVEELPSSQLIRYVAGVGETLPVHVGSAGKILLAFMPEREREDLLASLALIPVTENTITDEARLRKDILDAATSGVAISHGERIAGAVGISAPILGPNGHADASLSVLGPESRMTDEMLTKVEPLVRAAAAKLSQAERSGSPVRSGAAEAP